MCSLLRGRPFQKDISLIATLLLVSVTTNQRVGEDWV